MMGNLKYELEVHRGNGDSINIKNNEGYDKNPQLGLVDGINELIDPI